MIQPVTAPAVDAGAPADPPGNPEDPTAAAMRSLALQRAKFDMEVEERAEMEREADALRDLMLAQLKSEDQYLHKWIEMI